MTVMGHMNRTGCVRPVERASHVPHMPNRSEGTSQFALWPPLILAYDIPITSRNATVILSSDLADTLVIVLCRAKSADSIRSKHSRAREREGRRSA